MDETFERETEKLQRSWGRHEPAMLRDYLVAGVEDPRLNVQSVLSRHFILRFLAGERFRELAEQELRFAAAMNWLLAGWPGLGDAEAAGDALLALRRGVDQVEGVAIPAFIGRTFAALPAVAEDLTIPNYLESSLSHLATGEKELPPAGLNVFRDLWRRALAGESSASPLALLEPACGSANDFRFLDGYGIARLIDYTGFDLCAANVANARTMMPGVRFELGNVFAIAAADQTYDLCFVHDLFEHLSISGLETAVREVCRVTRQGICAGFFQMDERPEHIVRPVDEYHWNTLSLVRVKALFGACGFAAQVLHIGTFLRQWFGCEFTHNPNAYTLSLNRVAGGR